jgi:Tol biopolymer transport system component
VSRPDGTKRHQITLQLPGRRFAWEPTWAPDGTRIVFSLFTRRAGVGRQGIYTADPDGGDVRAVALAGEGFYNNADWGPAR